MASQSASPQEAAVARAMLDAMGVDPRLERDDVPLSVVWDDGVRYEYGPNGLTVRLSVDGGIQPSMVAALLRAARAAEKAHRVG